MQQWEYLHVRVDHQEVTTINGQPLEKATTASGSPLKGQTLSELLAEVGEGGYDLVSHKMPHIGTEIMVFKRLKSKT